MAFAVRNLSVLAYAQGFTLWHYASADALAAVTRQGFFDGAADLLTGGDMMLISAPDGGRASFIRTSGNSVATVPLAA